MKRSAMLACTAAALSGCAPLRALKHMGESCVDVAVPAGDRGVVTTGFVLTRAVATPVGYELCVPRGVDPRTIERVVYVLPGRDGLARGSLAEIGFSGFAQELISAGSRPFAMLAIDAGSSYYHPRVHGEDRLHVVEHDLAPLARTLLSRKITAEAIAGQSMGGFGALLCAERDPRRYRAVAVAGPALFVSYADEARSVGDAFDDARQFASYDVIRHARRLAGVPVLVRIGTRDPFVPGARAFARACPTADVAYVPGGCHDTGLWRATAHDVLAFISRHW